MNSDKIRRNPTFAQKFFMGLKTRLMTTVGLPHDHLPVRSGVAGVVALGATAGMARGRDKGRTEERVQGVAEGMGQGR